MKKFVWKRPWYKNFYFSDIKINGLWIFLFLLFMSGAYYNDVRVYQEVYENPCLYCGCELLGGDAVWPLENGTSMLPKSSWNVPNELLMANIS